MVVAKVRQKSIKNTFHCGRNLFDLIDTNFFKNHYRKFESSSESSKTFKFYCFYAFGLTFLNALVMLILLMFYEKKMFPYLLFLLTSFVGLIIFDVIIFIMAGVKIFNMSRTGSFAKNSRFQLEKDRFDIFLGSVKFVTVFFHRFWNYLELHAILVVTYVTEFVMVVIFQDNSYNSLFISDIIKCFSAVLIFVILVSDQNVQVLIKNRYNLV